MEPDEIRIILESGNFDEFIGAVEGDRLECKSEPYQLDKTHVKLELAKDVTALANASGGFILIGVRTKKDPKHYGDEITRIRPFDREMVDPNQYLNTLGKWVYPTIKRIEVRWFASTADSEKGIAAIFIPDQPSAFRPFLITRTVDDKGKIIEVVFGYVERRHDRTAPIVVQELHARLKDGLRFDELSNQIESLQETIESATLERAPEEESPPQLVTEEMLLERMKEALLSVEKRSRPALILAAVPNQKVEITSLFESRDADIVNLLRNPPKLRNSGFDLDTDPNPRIIGGRLRRAVIPGYKVLDLWRDGTLIFIAAGDEDFLCWGSRGGGQGGLRINPLALIESTYLFVELSRRVFEHADPKSTTVKYKLHLQNMVKGVNPFYLAPGPVGSFGWTYGIDVRPAPAIDGVFEFDWEGSEINEREVAFRIVGEVYTWFGIEQDQIPYTERVDSRLAINPDQIREAGK